MSDTTGPGAGVIVDRGTAGPGTLTRPVSSARDTEAPGRVPRQRVKQRGQARPGATVAPPRSAPGRAAPGGTAGRTATTPAPAAAPAGLRGASPAAASRMPFIVLLCGLLGGALASALVISTTLAEGSFEISKLQRSDSALARQREALQNEVAQAQSAPVVEQRAYQLGMRPAGQLRFVNLKTGKVETDAGSGAVARISVPGYTP